MFRGPSLNPRRRIPLSGAQAAVGLIRPSQNPPTTLDFSFFVLCSCLAVQVAGGYQLSGGLQAGSHPVSKRAAPASPQPAPPCARGCLPI